MIQKTRAWALRLLTIVGMTAALPTTTHSMQGSGQQANHLQWLATATQIKLQYPMAPDSLVLLATISRHPEAVGNISTALLQGFGDQNAWNNLGAGFAQMGAGAADAYQQQKRNSNGQPIGFAQFLKD